MRDADRLSRLGAVSVTNYLLAAPAFSQASLDLAGIARSGIETLANRQAMGGGFYLEIGREWGQQRLDAWRVFFEALWHEAAS